MLLMIQSVSTVLCVSLTILVQKATFNCSDLLIRSLLAVKGIKNETTLAFIAIKSFLPLLTPGELATRTTPILVGG